jgi:hypothetical protein
MDSSISKGSKLALVVSSYTLNYVQTVAGAAASSQERGTLGLFVFSFLKSVVSQ